MCDDEVNISKFVSTQRKDYKQNDFGVFNNVYKCID